MIRPISAFVATGVVDSEVQQCPDKDSQWHDQPCVWVRDVSLLHRHVPLSKAKQYFPEWKFLKQPRRSTDVPKNYVGQFLRLLGVQGQDQFRPPEEVPSGSKYNEGSVQRILVNRYERDPHARKECIRIYGAKCAICGFDFGSTYGAEMYGFIHVHHLKLLSNLNSNYKVNPVKDLRPVCPNCHAVLHHRVPPYSIDEVKRFLAK